LVLLAPLCLSVTISEPSNALNDTSFSRIASLIRAAQALKKGQ
jgi:hypothetical protein